VIGEHGIDGVMTADEQHRLATTRQRFYPGRLGRALEDALRQRAGRLRHIGLRIGNHKVWRARQHPLAQDRWQLLGLGQAPNPQLGVEMQLHRLEVEVKFDIGRRSLQPHPAHLARGLAVDHERQVKRMQGLVLRQADPHPSPGRILRTAARQAIIRPRLPTPSIDDARRDDAHLRPAGQGDPLAEEALQALSRHLLERRLQLSPAGNAETLLRPEQANATFEYLLAQSVTQHHEHHRRLAIAHRRRRSMGARPEGRQWLVPTGRHRGEVAQPAQAHLARRLSGLGLLVGVVGHEGRQPLGPVAAHVIHQHAVAPPVVQHLMAERGGTDERQAQHLLADVGQRRHAETGRQRAGNHRELGEGIGADTLAVVLDVAQAVGEVAFRQPRLGVERVREIGAQAQGPAIGLYMLVLAYCPRPGHQIDTVAALVELENGAVARVGSRGQRLLHQTPGDKCTLLSRHGQLDPVGEQLGRARIPGAAGGQETALWRRHWGHALQHAAMVAAPFEHSERARVLDAQGRTVGHLYPPPSQAAALPGGLQLQRSACRTCSPRHQALMKHEAKVALGRLHLRTHDEHARRRIEADIQPEFEGMGLAAAQTVTQRGGASGRRCRKRRDQQPAQHKQPQGARDLHRHALSAPAPGSGPPTPAPHRRA